MVSLAACKCSSTCARHTGGTSEVKPHVNASTNRSLCAHSPSLATLACSLVRSLVSGTYVASSTYVLRTRTNRWVRCMVYIVTRVAGPPGATAPSYHFLIIYSNMAPLVSTLSIALPTYRTYQPTIVSSYCKHSSRELSSVNAFYSNRISRDF